MSFQDMLSSLKSAMTSDTAKTLAGTIAAGAVGGSTGINAFGNAIEANKQRSNQRDLSKIAKVKSDLEIENARESLNKKKLDNYSTIQDKIIGAQMPGLAGAVKSARSSSPKASLMDAIAVEPSAKELGLMNSPAVEPKPDKPIKLPAIPISVSTGATSTDPAQSGKYSTSKIDVPQKNLQRERTEGAEWARKFSKSVPELRNAGYDIFKKNSQMFADEFANAGLSSEQANGAKAELGRIMAPDYAANLQEMQNIGPATKDQQQRDIANSGGFSGMAKSFAQEWTPTALSAGTGIEVGAPFGPAGMAIGGIVGAVGGNAIGNLIKEAQPDLADAYNYIAGQSQTTSSPAIAGSDKTVSDMANYNEDTDYVNKIVNGLVKQGITAKDTPNIMMQLSTIPEIANNQERRNKILQMIQERLSVPQQQAQPAGSGMMGPLTNIASR